MAGGSGRSWGAGGSGRSWAGGSKEAPRKNFNKSNNNNSQQNSENAGGTEKKPFMKAQWREMKYNNRLKVDQWQQRREQTAKYFFNKILHKDDETVKVKPSDQFLKRPKKKTVQQKIGGNSSDSLANAQKIYWEIRKEKTKQVMKAERIKAERAKALAEYATRKTERFKKLSGKTKYGQPLMRGRIQLMLEEIEKMTGRRT